MDNHKDAYALVLGASIVDIFGFCEATYSHCNSTPGSIKMSFGGVCRNIAENMARVGVNTKFISILGNDEKGKSMLEHSRMMGYNMDESLILEDGATPTYLAILDHKGEMVSAVVDMDSINKLSPEFIDSKATVIENAEYTILDSDNPVILGYILNKFKGKTKFVLDPVSACKAANIKHLIGNFHTIKPNRYEAEVLAGFPIKNDEDLKKASDYFHGLGVEKIFISLDEDGIYFSDGEKRGKYKVNNVPVVNVTGAGDAFVAGLAYGYINGLSIEDTVVFSIAMSTITIAHEETIDPNMNLDLVNRNIEELSWTKIDY
ncbi:carbohydrate kinase family protein [Clostridium hydrogeniformans]|uniref:carbohydrate kinase family protein n=1 Tax=Clostridium hydrogeniformans TaxID=349933 RepID=UPI0004839DC7|nr:carbohydrate kinase family protein [Clostridium hydrogeniformans]